MDDAATAWSDSLRVNVNRAIRTGWTEAEIDDVMAFLETLTDEDAVHSR